MAPVQRLLSGTYYNCHKEPDFRPQYGPNTLDADGVAPYENLQNQGNLLWTHNFRIPQTRTPKEDPPPFTKTLISSYSCHFLAQRGEGKPPSRLPRSSLHQFEASWSSSLDPKSIPTWAKYQYNEESAFLYERNS